MTFYLAINVAMPIRSPVRTSSQCPPPHLLTLSIGFEAIKVVTTSSDRAFQSALKAKRHLVQQSQQKEAEAMVSVYMCMCVPVYLSRHRHV